METISVKTNGERFYEITEEVRRFINEESKALGSQAPRSGLLFLWNPHTSCALTISEAYDPSARKDMENFLKHLAPTHLPFIEHTDEGPDDSPSHMKSILLQPSLLLPIEDNALVLGQWQGIYLAEFRRASHNRKILTKILWD